MELEHGQLARWSVTARLCPGILPQFLLQGCRAEKATLNLEGVLVCYRPWDKLSSFFLPADHRILVGGSHISSHHSHFARFVEGWAEPVWLQRTDTSTSSWVVWHQSRSLWQPRCSARTPWRAEPMEGQVSEPVPSPWLPGLDQGQAPGWPSITPAGCWPWQGWDAHSLLCHLHGLIPPECFQQVF